MFFFLLLPLNIKFYKIIQIVRALWLAIKPFYMSVCKHGFRSSFISYFSVTEDGFDNFKLSITLNF